MMRLVDLNMEIEALISLSGERGKGRTAKVDLCYLESFSLMNWHMTGEGYARNGQHGFMHRYVMELRGFNIDGFMVDHINGDRLDNRSSNLRVVTAKGNAKNKHNDPVHDNLVGVRRGPLGFETVHRNAVWYENTDAGVCALCYDSIMWYCYGNGKRLNDNISSAPLPIETWNLCKELMAQLTKIKESYTDFIGVKKVKDGWKATIKVELGVFETQIEAAEAYNRALRAVKVNPKPEEFNRLQ